MPLDDEISGVQRSLLQRLIDDNPDQQAEIRPSLKQSLSEVRDAVREDLARLLNTRAYCRPWSPQLEELRKSVVSYGLHDGVISGMAADDWRGLLRRAIEDAIRVYEPRLTDVAVTLVDEPENLERSLRFRIEATLVLEAEQATVTFDSKIETATRVVLLNR
jgi:type VI secretion system protein ImpF